MALLVRLVVRRLQGGKEVSGIDDSGYTADLAEAERGLERGSAKYDLCGGKTNHNSSTNTISMDGLGWEHEESAFSEVRIDVAAEDFRKKVGSIVEGRLTRCSDCPGRYQ
jgi:hypothetical protein